MRNLCTVIAGHIGGGYAIGKRLESERQSEMHHHAHTSPRMTRAARIDAGRHI